MIHVRSGEEAFDIYWKFDGYSQALKAAELSARAFQLGIWTSAGQSPAIIKSAKQTIFLNSTGNMLTSCNICCTVDILAYEKSPYFSFLIDKIITPCLKKIANSFLILRVQSSWFFVPGWKK